jgi:stage II sporulation protein P
MIISGADNGYLNMPNFRKNLRFASHLQNSMETLYPGFTRPILFDYRNYNQQLTTGSLLIEVGGHANTLEEAQNSAHLIAQSLAHTFDNVQ